MEEKDDKKFVLPFFANSVEIKASPFEIKFSYYYKFEENQARQQNPNKESKHKEKHEIEAVLLGEFIISPEHAKQLYKKLGPILDDVDRKVKLINEKEETTTKETKNS